MKILNIRNAKWNQPEKLTFDCEILTDAFPDEWLPFTYSPDDGEPHVMEMRETWLAENASQITEISQSEFNVKVELQAASVVCQQRNNLLVESDKRVLPDRWAAMTPEQQQAWSTYRQALRDIPEQVGFPFDIAWPQMP